MFRTTFDAGGGGRSRSAVIAAVNSVIALFYYANVIARRCGSTTPDRRDTAPRSAVRRPAARGIAISPRSVVIGVYPQLFARVGEVPRCRPGCRR